jgi:hypothetical protein
MTANNTKQFVPLQYIYINFVSQTSYINVSQTPSVSLSLLQLKCPINWVSIRCTNRGDAEEILFDDG